MAGRPEPPVLSATMPLNVAGTVAAWKRLPFAGDVTDAAVGGVTSKNVTVGFCVIPIESVVSVAVYVTASVVASCHGSANFWPARNARTSGAQPL